MKRFTYPLEKALEIRELKKLLAEERLGKAQHEEARTRERLSEAVDMRDRCFEDIRASVSGKVDPGEVKQLFKFESSVEDEIWRQKTDLVKRESQTRQATSVVVARTQEERTLLIHRDDRLAAYKALYWWEQGKELDELGSARFIRNKGGEK